MRPVSTNPSHSLAFANGLPLRLRIRVRTVLLASLALLALLVAGVLIPFADSRGELHLFFEIFLVITVLGILFSVPVRFLPVIILLVTLLVPTETTLLPHTLQGAALGLLPLAVWLIRAPTATTRGPLTLRVLNYLLAAWLALSYIFAPFHTHRGLEWLVTFGLAVVFVIMRPPANFKAKDFRALFLDIATLLGVYALLEGFFLHSNVLFAKIFEHDTWWHAQRYNASYRVTTLLGHPLFNGLVFSAAAVLAASDLVQRSRRTPLALLRFIILVGATDATHSRGAAIALAVGVIVVILFSRGRERGWKTRRLILATSLLLGAAILVYGLKARNESHEGQSSAETRITVIKRASEALHHVEPFGAGPGESDAYRKATQLPGWETDLENSYAELTVSLGPIGVLLISALLITVVFTGLRNESVTGETAALLAILIDMAGLMRSRVTSP